VIAGDPRVIQDNGIVLLATNGYAPASNREVFEYLLVEL
jgi:hypothetical protein